MDKAMATILEALDFAKNNGLAPSGDIQEAKTLLESLQNPLNKLASDIHKNAVEHGWYEEDPGFPTAIANFHAELSEAFEEYRCGRVDTWYSCSINMYGSCVVRETCEECKHGKPEGVPAELIDCVIRILDTCCHMGVDVDKTMRDKCRFNLTRPYRHGGKRC